MKILHEKLNEPEMYENFQGLFPMENEESLRFSINFFTYCGLKGLTYDMREKLQQLEDQREHNLVIEEIPEKTKPEENEPDPLNQEKEINSEKPKK